jgi:hypothetical protein
LLGCMMETQLLHQDYRRRVLISVQRSGLSGSL